MDHTIECEARGSHRGSQECDACLSAGEHTAAAHCIEQWDEGNGFQSWHYCEECWDSLAEE